MKKIDLGQTVNTVANLGVIVGIIFLAMELQQNRELTTAQIRHEVSQADIEGILRETYDLDTASLFLRAIEGEDLTEAEAFKFQGLLQAWFRTIENVRYQYRAGLFDEAEFLGQVAIWKARFSQPAILEVWCQSQPLYSEAFIQDLERLADVSC